VGGIREKALAAKRMGLKTFILPALNEPDLKELPEEIRKDMRFAPVESLEQVLAIALPKTAAAVADAPVAPEPL
jgi:ATP-dependent Lon protease